MNATSATQPMMLLSQSMSTVQSSSSSPKIPSAAATCFQK